MTIPNSIPVRKMLGRSGRDAVPIVWNAKFLTDPFGESSPEGAILGAVPEAEAVSELPRPTPLATSKTATIPSTPTEPKKPDASTGRTTSSSVASTLLSCGAHLDPHQWYREPVTDRPGWELATCKHCGKPIGCNRIAATQTEKFPTRKKPSTCQN